MSKIINKPEPTLANYIAIAQERLADCDGFLLVSIKNQDVSVAAIITQEQDFLIALGVEKFIEQRAQALLALEQAANEAIH